MDFSLAKCIGHCIEVSTKISSIYFMKYFM